MSYPKWLSKPEVLIGTPTYLDGQPKTPVSPEEKPGEKEQEAATKQEHFASVNFIKDRPRFEAQYRYYWSICRILPEWQKEAETSVAWALGNREMFLRVAQEFSMPWYVVAVLNLMEQGRSFAGTLLNGDRWDAVTVRHPKGKGPWLSWEDAALYAIADEAKRWNFKLDKWKWDLGGVFFYCNAWNGFTHALAEGKDIVPPFASPYIYSGTPFYSKGKRVERKDENGIYRGSFDKNLVSKQLGVMAFFWELNKREPLFKKEKGIL